MNLGQTLNRTGRGWEVEAGEGIPGIERVRGRLLGGEAPECHPELRGVLRSWRGRGEAFPPLAGAAA